MQKSLPIRIHLPSGETKYRVAPSLEHGDLCRVCEMDPIRTRFDLPRNPAPINPGRRVEGVIFFNGEPVGRIFVAREGETFRDLDPTSPGDFWNQCPTRC